MKPARQRPAPSFRETERASQSDWLIDNVPKEARGAHGHDFCLHPPFRHLNLAPSIRNLADSYFRTAPAGPIAWHRWAHNALSSQVSCLNFLMPIAGDADLLAGIVGHCLGIDPPELLEIARSPKGQPWFVDFEWIGRENYLNEAAPGARRTRGANYTSPDAIVRFRHLGLAETLLIEWKYAEAYSSRIDQAKTPTRTERYRNIAFEPNGPVRANPGIALTDFFYEPFYQFLREQMLAWRMQEAKEDGAERVRVLHLSPAGNLALHSVTSPRLRCLGDDAFEVFRSLLVRPDDFVSRSIEDVFWGPLTNARGESQAWAEYLPDRYAFLRGVA